MTTSADSAVTTPKINIPMTYSGLWESNHASVAGESSIGMPDSASVTKSGDTIATRSVHMIAQSMTKATSRDQNPALYSVVA